MNVKLTKEETLFLKSCKSGFNNLRPDKCIVPLLKRMLNGVISQRRLSKIIGSQSTGHVSNILAGRKNLTLLNAIELAESMKLNNTQKVALYEAVSKQTKTKLVK